MSNEQQQQQADENAKQQAVSLRWMSANLHRYKPDSHSAQLIAEFLQNYQMPWTEENLDKAFDTLVEDGQIQESENTDMPAAQPAPPVTPDPNVPPWSPSPLTKAAVRTMSVQEMKKFLSDKKFGKQFEQEIRDLKITKGDSK